MKGDIIAIYAIEEETETPGINSPGPGEEVASGHEPTFPWPDSLLWWHWGGGGMGSGQVV